MNNKIKLHLSMAGDINGINLKWSFIKVDGRQLSSAILLDCEDEDDDEAIEPHVSNSAISKLARL